MNAGPPAPPACDIAPLLRLLNEGNLAVADPLAADLTRRFPEDAFCWKIRAEIARRAGRPEDALSALREAVRCEPGDPSAHRGAGEILHALGRFADAEASYRNALRLKPDDAAAWCNLGVTLAALDRPAEAESAARAAIAASPDLALAHFNLGNMLQARDRLDESAASYRTAIRWAPDFADARYNLANALAALGLPAEAEAEFRAVLRLEPDRADALNNLGNLLGETGRLAEAEPMLRRAVALAPGLAAAHANLGAVRYHLGRLPAAEADCRAALALDPGHVEARTNLGVVLADLGRSDQAEAALREAIRLAPARAQLRSNLLFHLNCTLSAAPERAFAEAVRQGAEISARAASKYSVWKVSPSDARLRIGFVSGDLRGHPVGRFLEGTIACLDRGAFDLFAFPTSPKADGTTARLAPHFRGWVPLHGLGDRAAAAAIHDLGIHVLFDLSGHTADNRLPVFAYRPAPVQATWLGYFATTGLPEIGNFVGDPHVAPESERAGFTETLRNLPASWFCLPPPDAAPAVAPPPASRDGHATFGCFGNLAKMGAAVVETWAEILAAAPGVKLFLKSGQLADGAAADATRARFAAHGIAPDRLILEGPSPHPAYLDRYGRVDAVLDTFPYPGGTTSLEAIWMGVPVLTLDGASFLSRFGRSIALNLGKREWLAADRAAYVRNALAFAQAPPTRLAERAALRELARRSALFDVRRFAADFGVLAAAMYREWAAAAVRQPGGV